NEPGTYDLGDFIQWIFFDPVQEKYDTLKSEIQIQVQGESRKNEYISSNDLGSFYDRIELEDNQLVSIKSGMGYKIIINLFIFAILVGGIVLFFKK
ncbi:MAG: BatD family protein, partial [Cytophagales bacterium]